jgi:hypothetical protein
VAVNGNQGINVYEKATNYGSLLSLVVPNAGGAVLYHQGSNQIFVSTAGDILQLEANPPTLKTMMLDPTTVTNGLSCTSSGEWLAAGGDGGLLIYKRTAPFTFAFPQSISFGASFNDVAITDDGYLFAVDAAGSLLAFQQ